MGLLTKIFGTYSARELKQIYPIVDGIERKREDYMKLEKEELIAKTAELKSRLAQGETLDDILPDAFATVREASRRVLKQEPFRVQLVGGVVLHQGRIAEMKTGEGKTLVAILPAYLNALTGKGVHIVTVNDYLARYGSEWVGKVFRYLGLSVGLIVHGMDKAQRKAAYAADITYGTNNEMGFDYLRDNMALSPDGRVQRGHNFAIVDEVDSILIDEARTPLIISGMGEKPTELYDQADKFVRLLKKKVVAETDDKAEEAADEDADYIVDEKTRTATLTSRGIAKAESFFHLENLSDPENATIAHHINQAIKAHGVMKVEVDYVIKDGQVIIVDEFTGRLMFGRRYNEGLHQAIEAKENVEVARESKTLATITFQNYFRIYKKLSGMTGTALTEEEEFGSIYKLDVVEIPTNKEMIRKDDHDVVYKTEAAKYRAVVEQIKECHEKGQPVLVGTVSIEKNEYLSRLLKKAGIEHNLLNAKNHESEAEIVAQAGKLGAVTVATNMAGRGTDIILGGNAEFRAKKDLRQFLSKFPEPAALLKTIIGKDPHELLNKKDLLDLEGRKDPDGFPTREDLLELLSMEGLRKLLTERAPRELLAEKASLTGEDPLAEEDPIGQLTEKDLRGLFGRKNPSAREALLEWLYDKGLIRSKTKKGLDGWLKKNTLRGLLNGEALRELVTEEVLREFLDRKDPRELLVEKVLGELVAEEVLRERLTEKEPFQYLSKKGLLKWLPEEDLGRLVPEETLVAWLYDKHEIPSRDGDELQKWLEKNDLRDYLARKALNELLPEEGLLKWLSEQDPHELLNRKDPLELLTEKCLLEYLGRDGLLGFAGKDELLEFIAGKPLRDTLRRDVRNLTLPSLNQDTGYRKLVEESRRQKDSKSKEKLEKDRYRKKLDEIFSVATGFAETDVFVIRYIRELFTWYMEKYKLEIEGEADKVRATGGLFIVGTERHDSRRIDNQLRGRAGRQGDPGESRFYLSLEDDLMRLFGGDRITNLMERLDIDEDMPIENKMLTKAIENAQTSVEARNFQVRKNTLEYDDVMNTQREIIYGQRKQVLDSNNTRDLITGMISTLVASKVHDAFGEAKHLDDDGYRTMIASLEGTFFPRDSVQFTPEEIATADAETFIQRFTDEALKKYEAKEKEIEAAVQEIEAEKRAAMAGEAGAGDEADDDDETDDGEADDDEIDDEEIDIVNEDIPEIPLMRKLEQDIMLRVVDEYWMDHIDAMEDLRQGIRLRAYAQSNPIDAYKNESLHMFEEMVSAIQEETVRRLYSMHPVKSREAEPRPIFRNVTEGRGGGAAQKRVKQQPRRVQKIGRNDPCPCGSGKKYKNCCGRNA